MAAFSFNAWGISFTIITDNAEVVRDVARELSSAAITLGAIYGLKSLIDRALTITFGGNDRDDQNGPDIRPGSLHVSIRCLTEARFLEVLEDYESGKIKHRLQEELLKVGIKTKGLKIKIDNMEEVEKTKTAIKNRKSYSTAAKTNLPVVERKLSTTEQALKEFMDVFPPEVPPAIIVQGGGFAVDDDRKIYRDATEHAANVGYHVLMRGGTAVEAVEQAVRVFEEHGHFNAGRGSCLNTAGEVECDALIMDGHEMKTGAVIGARHFRHPVTMAKKVMEESPHCALTGEGAHEFALLQGNFGHEICDPEDLKGDDCPYQKIKVVNQQFQEFTKFVYVGRAISDEQKPDNATSVGGGQPTKEQNRKPGYDTASAVAIDSKGRLACANSTGGIPGKLKGRVSDASLVGCGAYANKSGAAATNGPGESIMKMTLAREAVYNMEQGQNAQEAAVNAVQKMTHINGCGGVIAIAKDGDFGIAFNTLEAVWAKKKNNHLESGMRISEFETYGGLK